MTKQDELCYTVPIGNIVLVPSGNITVKRQMTVEKQ